MKLNSISSSTPHAHAHSTANSRTIKRSILILTLAVALVALAVPSVSAGEYVNVDFYVMSKCPDASLCQTLFQPAINATINLIDLNVHYIAKKKPNTSPPLFECKHGSSECLGNVEQLCAHYLYNGVRAGNSLVWFNFVECMGRTYSRIPSNGPECASQHGIEWNKIEQCLQDGTAASLFSRSVAAVASRSVAHSCTVYVGDQLVAEHNGRWSAQSTVRTAEQLKHAICEAAGKRSEECE